MFGRLLGKLVDGVILLSNLWRSNRPKAVKKVRKFVDRILDGVEPGDYVKVSWGRMISPCGSVAGIYLGSEDEDLSPHAVEMLLVIDDLGRVHRVPRWNLSGITVLSKYRDAEEDDGQA